MRGRHGSADEPRAEPDDRHQRQHREPWPTVPSGPRPFAVVGNTVCSRLNTLRDCFKTAESLVEPPAKNELLGDCKQHGVIRCDPVTHAHCSELGTLLGRQLCREHALDGSGIEARGVSAHPLRRAVGFVVVARLPLRDSRPGC